MAIIIIIEELAEESPSLLGFFIFLGMLIAADWYWFNSAMLMFTIGLCKIMFDTAISFFCLIMPMC